MNKADRKSCEQRTTKFTKLTNQLFDLEVTVEDYFKISTDHLNRKEHAALERNGKMPVGRFVCSAVNAEHGGNIQIAKDFEVLQSAGRYPINHLPLWYQLWRAAVK